MIKHILWSDLHILWSDLQDFVIYEIRNKCEEKTKCISAHKFNNIHEEWFLHFNFWFYYELTFASAVWSKYYNKRKK